MNISNPLIWNSAFILSNQAVPYLFFIKDDIFVGFIFSINCNANSIVSSLKCPSFTNIPYLSNKSVSVFSGLFNGINLTSVLDGAISDIHNLSNLESLPALLFIRVICVLNIPFTNPASPNNLSTSIKYSFGKLYA